MDSTAGPLAGVRVVDFGQYVAGPGAAQVLADLGADVVKVESPGGDPARGIGAYGEAMMRCYNRRKRSIAVDLKNPEGAAVAWRLVAEADVVVQNMRPGAMRALGFGPRDVRRLNPGVVYVEISGFGVNGPSRERAALDIAAQAESGIMNVTGEAEGDPQRVGFVLVDAAAAANAAQAVLAALFRRERTGEGDHVELSLLGVAIHLQGTVWSEYEQTGNLPRRKGNGQPTLAPAADLVRTSDGKIVLSAYTDKHWRQLCALIDRLDLVDDRRFADNAARVANREELAGVLGDAFGSYTSEEAVRLLSTGGVVAGAVRDHEEVIQAPDVTEGGHLVAGTVAGECFHTPTLPFRMASWPVTEAGSPPAVGEHTVGILRELGYSEDAIESLGSSGAVTADAISKPR
ncbi:CoA transferase [Prauserella halophila]|uniref:CoA transferase n=2 Tax=Prauserella halophila TaxID=185641 RepID=A0ABN1WFX0_9PSEU|nr:Crotonobetainyl-CoA:carnitine CoA-transferase CaiB [Prauserella halophila]